MLKNYFLAVVRNLWRRKFFSLLTVLGLAIGMACYLLIFQYVNYELSHDRFHENKNDIYRLQRDVYENNVLKNSYARTSYNVGPAMKAEFPEIKEVVRCATFADNTVSYGEQKFRDENIYVAESSLFKIFSFPMVKGDPDTALAEPNKVVVSQTTARRYFGDEEPMGKMIRILNKGVDYTCMVNGVFADIPDNSHMTFDLVVSAKTFFNPSFSDWIFSRFHTYFLLNPGADAKALEAKLPAFIDKYIVQNVPRAANWKLLLQPLTKIYLYSDLTYDTENGNGTMVYFLLVIAFLILIISWINYVNLSTARSMERAREVGMRKVFGGHRLQLIKQFLAESVMVNLIPILLALLLVVQFIPFLRDLTGKAIPLSLSGDFWFWLHVVALYVVGSLLSGLYPAFVLSSYQPVTVLNRSRFSHTGSGKLLRKILVVFQFAASGVLIILTAAVYLQIDYMRNRELGININDMVGIPLPSTPLNQDYLTTVDSFKNELLRYPGIKGVTGSLYVPGSDPFMRRLAWKENTDFKEGKMVSVLLVDYDFLPLYQIRMLADGRNFSKAFGTDRSAAILNEAAAKSLDFADPASAKDQVIKLWQMPGSYKIIGVIENYYHQSLKKSVDPMVILLDPRFKNIYSVKLDPANSGEALSIIEQEWSKSFPGFPFDYFFVDDHFNQQYKADYQFGKVLGIFVVLAILITCMGLLSLSYFSTLQRTKEIGIRKSFGATVGEILALLVKDTVKLVSIGILIAWFFAYFIIDIWLKDYANRIAMPWLVFIFSAVILAMVSILTVSYHSFVAARTNPVEALREE